MSFDSVDALQKTLADSVFKYARDRKKAAGRALGTLVEIITFYTLRAWELRDYIAIERSLPEFANPDIVHNVEFSLHPLSARYPVRITPLSLPLSAVKLRRQLPFLREMPVKSVQIISVDGVKRNACVIAEDAVELVVAHTDALDNDQCDLTVCCLLRNPFALFECKRVGVEDGVRKGPQTIEKAKQGAYVARTVSALQKVRLRDGQFQGVLEERDGVFRTGPYAQLVREIIDSPHVADMQGFILTVGVVSNHGNWFTSSNQNKELRVLAQSYDWLLFLTDVGLSQFIDRLLLHPSPELEAVREAFLTSYSGLPDANRFTKINMSAAADAALCRYFATHEAEVATWFSVIAPRDAELSELQTDLHKLANKDWGRLPT